MCFGYFLNLPNVYVYKSIDKYFCSILKWKQIFFYNKVIIDAYIYHYTFFMFYIHIGLDIYEEKLNSLTKSFFIRINFFCQGSILFMTSNHILWILQFLISISYERTMIFLWKTAHIACFLRYGVITEN